MTHQYPDTIECPECQMVQDAWIKKEPDLPYAIYVHNCNECGYTIMESEWNSVKFDRDRIYTASEIKDNSVQCQGPEEYEGMVYIVAGGRDGREYWFIKKGNGWQVDHTWGIFVLGDVT